MKKKLLSLLCGATMLAAALTGGGSRGRDNGSTRFCGRSEDCSDHHGFH